MADRKEEVFQKAPWEEDAGHQEQLSPLSRLKAYISTLGRPSATKKLDLRSPQASRTAYLDGLRGFAAFLVYWGHHQLWAHEALSADRILENAFGYEQQYYFACLPGIRTFFSGGHFSVTVFFVLSGYVLSSKPLVLIHAGEQLRLAETLSSALFRRWLRLHIPVICTTFLYMTSWHLLGYRPDQEPRSTYYDELWNWYTEIKNFTFIFRTGGDPWFSYSFHTWSIPVEFKGSIVIYTSLLAFSRATRNARLMCEVGLMVYFMYIVDGAFCALFVAGMFLCDLELLAQDHALPHFLAKMSEFKTVFFYAMFFLAIYLGGCPSHSQDVYVLRDSLGWHYLSFLKPQAVYDYKWFYLFWAAIFLVGSISRISWLRRFFESPFNQYLGRVSFAFYLVHGPVLWTLGDRLYAAVGWSREAHATTIPGWINLLPLPKFGPLGLEPSFLLPHLVLLPVTLWLAEIGTRLIDEPSVTFSHWLYRWTLCPAPKL